MFKTLDDAWFWCSILTLEVDIWFWRLTFLYTWFWHWILTLVFDACFWRLGLILMLDFDAGSWCWILMLDFDAGFWCWILMLDFDTWFWLFELALQTNKWTNNANSRVASRLKIVILRKVLVSQVLNYVCEWRLIIQGNKLVALKS